MNHDHQTDKYHLLGLPAEVRNRIYRFALIENDVLELSATSPTPPGLLIVSKQIREETVAMYYTENRFILVIVDFDGEAVTRPVEVYRKCFTPTGTGAQAKQQGIIGIYTAGVPNWRNLVGWCKAIHRGSMPVLKERPGGGDRMNMSIAAIHKVVWGMRSRPWEEVEEVFEGFRKIMVLLDQAWAT